LDSFLIWNVKKAVLYVKDERHFSPQKHWSLGSEISRADVRNYEDEWIQLKNKILSDLDYYFQNGTIEGKKISENFNEGIAAEIINLNLNNDIEKLQEKANEDGRFKAEVTVWWDQHKKVYQKGSNKWEVLAKKILISWINKFLFGHILKLYQGKARVLNELSTDSSLEEFRDVFHSISKNCDFWNVFKETLGESYISNNSKENLVELNGLLSDLNFESIEHSLLKELFQKSVLQSRSKFAGQFVTPATLARILTGLVFTEIPETFYDPFCGTGTIVKSAYQMKLDSDPLIKCTS
jgi:hypothetical protein